LLLEEFLVKGEIMKFLKIVYFALTCMVLISSISSASPTGPHISHFISQGICYSCPLDSRDRNWGYTDGPCPSSYSGNNKIDSCNG